MPAKKRKKLKRKDIPTHEETLPAEYEEWPDAEEVIGKFPHLYNVKELIDRAQIDKEHGSADHMVENMKLHPYQAHMLASEAEVEELPYPGATKFLHWTVHFTLQAGDSQLHPMNRKVRMWFDLCEMKQNMGLSETAVERCVLLAGTRFKPARKYSHGPKEGPPKGTITITSSKYPDREDNRRHIIEMFVALMEESAKAGTPQDPLVECEDYQMWTSEKQSRKSRRDLMPYN
eukprot:CAMPEP_0196579708 /NCGR_PEP_ID=MMETSP1081-20130531/24469_1 /TAXON_ID=36882 /ORGANISM="Pyramimonas amylifera, Strain CCMP720" /LENGTH=231 /DNA_ID=CAMNT_0041899371 /DNA_START=352 /DNA_END=1047 /DNA_ORIENTATION=-